MSDLLAPGTAPEDVDVDAPARAELLELVRALAAAKGQPVRLAWVIAAIELGHLDSDVDFSKERLGELCTVLGRRPRRSRAFLLLGDLVDIGTISLSSNGIRIPD